MKIVHSKYYLLAVGIVFLGCSSTAMATAIGPLNVANCSGGGVTVTATTIVWAPNGTVAGTGCIDTGLGTNVTYSGGTLGAGVAGNIKNLPAGSLPVDQFMTFQGSTLDFVLGSLGPGSSNTNCAGLAVGSSCSVFAGSPFLLTNLGGGETSVGLTAMGTVMDGGVTTAWKGVFTTQLNLDAATIQTDINNGGSIVSTHSGQFTVSSVPEPTTFTMLLLGGVALLGSQIRKRSKTLL
jgi:hypothetical protein